MAGEAPQAWQSPRTVLERLVRDRGEDYASLSRMLGRNGAYIQQYLKRGSPRCLSDADRQRLAEHFGVHASVLAEPARTTVPIRGVRLARPPRLDSGEWAGAKAPIAFEHHWLRALARNEPEDIAMLVMRGDAMAPTLVDGDIVLVDRRIGVASGMDGLYALRIAEVITVRRIAVMPRQHQLAIASDNPRYPDWETTPGETPVLGRVCWLGHQTV